MGQSTERNRKTFSICVSSKGYEKILDNLSHTTCRSLSEYGRKVLAGEPVTVYYRNKSFDEFTEAAILLKKRLDGILIAGIIREPEKDQLTRDVKIIKETLIKIYDYERQNYDHKKHL
jgi:hypothetical protein